MTRRLLLLAALCPALCAALVAPATRVRSALGAAAAKKKATGGSGFGAAPRAKTTPPAKPIKSLVADCRRKWPIWRDERAADVWVAAREGKRWFHAGRVCCASAASLAGAVQLQKNIIFKLAVTLDETLMQAPSGLIAATADVSLSPASPFFLPPPLTRRT